VAFSVQQCTVMQIFFCLSTKFRLNTSIIHTVDGRGSSKYTDTHSVKISYTSATALI